MLRIFLISVFLIFSNLAFGKYISFLDPKSELIISKYLGKKFLIGSANYSFLFWNIYDAELYSTSNKFNSNECISIKTTMSYSVGCSDIIRIYDYIDEINSGREITMIIFQQEQCKNTKKIKNERIAS